MGHKRERERPRPKSLTSAAVGLPVSREEAEQESPCQTMGTPGQLAGSGKGEKPTAAFSRPWTSHFSTIFRMWNFKDSLLDLELLKTRTIWRNQNVTLWLAKPELDSEATLWPCEGGQCVGTGGSEGQSACESNRGCSETEGIF